ncbi:ShlB/FhaC/HecB family hemolysin secretion/activation protein [Herminiimonas glaciei]|uniref:ShlB/FhaC/HecB family hemolysin secretion/activation protein n=1 Tax=Herminiimonas glaciei TaxID=523788 RepID=A0ABW2I8U3_9BURK
MKHRLMSVLAGTLLAVSCASAFADTATPSIHFDINRFDVRGNTLLPPQTVDSLVAPYLGKDRDFADVMKALEALEAAYHARGYQLVRIDLPEQELNQGTVVLNVVQTKIGNVVIEGNSHFDDANIRRSLPALQEGQTPDLKAVSKSLKLANENPAKKVTMRMKSAEQDDEVDATLAVVDESVWRTTINFDNTGVASTGRTRAGVVLQNANMFGLDHVMSLQYTTTLEEPSRVGVYGIGYHIPLYALGDSMDFYASYSDVDAGTVTAGIFDIAVSGKGSMYGARYNQNLATVGNYASKLMYGIDLKQYKNSMQLLGVELGADITVRPVSVGYQGDWSWGDGAIGFATTLLHNISGGSNGSQSDFDRVRFDAKANYTAIRVGGSLTQALPEQWLARAIINGQYTKDALIPGEQFGAGGAASVRGFLEREVANDSGITGNFEVYTAPLCGSGKWQCRALAFYDHAYLTRNHALPGEFSTISINSVGLGLRLQLGNDVNFQVDVGHVLHAEATTTRSGDNRVHARLALSF